MNSSSTCWIKPDDLKKLLEKNGFTVNITDFTEVKTEEKKEDKKNKTINKLCQMSEILCPVYRTDSSENLLQEKV